MAPNEWFVQPYVGAGFLWGLSVENDDYIMSSTTGGYSYGMQGHVDLPWFSIGPVVGVDLYLFSCIALQLEYGYRWGIDALVDANSLRDVGLPFLFDILVGN